MLGKIVLLGAALIVSVSPRAAAEPQVVDVPPGIASDVYYQINVSGTVYLKIAAEAGREPCGEFWWVKWGLGSVEQLGRRCGSFSLKIPGITQGVVSSKLRVGGPPHRLRIAVIADESVASTMTISIP